ncbi:MAG: hypothetical protein JOZ08_21560 [Verrucomicrobia bacterium]|nr:hypothetical protein [Verrucomicrobiota bacterium]MBV8278058.1 hypothetical protein [Verrucomicrobiota bacterium]
MADSEIDFFAYIDAGLLQSCVSELPPLYREDVLNSLLLAQLAADKKFSRFSEVDAWYNFYGNTLSHLAWQVTGFAFHVYKPAGEHFYLKDVIETQFSGRVDSREFKAVKASIEQYNKLPLESKARQVFSRSTQLIEAESALVNAQVGVAWGSSDLSVVCAIFGTTQSITQLFDEEIETELLQGNIRLVTYAGALNETVYGGLRKSVLEKLGPKREELIVAIDL